jgi:hypothetical protein
MLAESQGNMRRERDIKKRDIRRERERERYKKRYIRRERYKKREI